MPIIGVDRTAGTAIGDFTSMVDAFDGVTSQASGASANKSLAAGASGYIGKSWPSAKRFIGATIYGSNNQGFVSTANPTTTLRIRGKNGAAPTGPTDGTDIGSITFTDTVDESAGRAIASTDSATAWDHWFLEIVNGDASTRVLRVAEIGWDEYLTVVTMSASTGSFALTGQTATLRANRILAVQPATFALSGADAVLRPLRKLVAVRGQFNLAGQAAALRAQRALLAQVRALTLTGQTAVLRAQRRLPVTTGAFSLAGSDVALRANRVLKANSRSYTLTGRAAGLRVIRRLNAGTAAFALTGYSVTFFFRKARRPYRHGYDQESGEAYVALVRIDSPQLDEPVWLTDAGGTYNETLDTYTFDVEGQTFICAPIEVIPPGDARDEEPRGSLRVPNVDQRIGAAIEALSGPASVTITIVLESDPTQIMGGPYQMLDLRNVRGDAMQIEGDLSWPSLSAEPWPWDWIRPGKFRAAFRM